MCEKSRVFNSKSVPTYHTRTFTKKAYCTIPVALQKNVPYCHPWVQREFSCVWMRCSAACGQGLRTQRSLRMHFLLSTPSPPVFPISAKKCKIFSGIFALKFCKFWRFFSCQKAEFLFPAKNRRQLWFMAPHSGMSHKSRRKLAELKGKTFFLEINKIDRCLRQRDDLFFFFFFFEITLKPDKKGENFRHFHIVFRTFALFLAFSQEVKS